MNFQDYEREQFFVYEEFAETVRLILEKAIEGSEAPRPQAIQARAKSIQSLRDRLEEGGNLNSNEIENVRRDLAGVRIIFYTNTDVDRFGNLRLISENFHIERDATRIHHPMKENDERRYRAIHYTVRLKDDRAKLPEYSKFNGLRCEIQIQTILNHSWSETSHDIVYKKKLREGFGSKALESITHRLDRIMDKYLLPAGYEFQRVQQDYERLLQGKELFDQNILDALQTAEDNNERHELLTSLKEQVLPNYDDLPAIYRDLVKSILQVARSARGTADKSITTPFGDLVGKTADDVVGLVIEILNMLRFIDIERTFDAISEIFRDEGSEEVRNKILDTAKGLAKYDLDVWKKVGPQVQSRLVDAATQVTVEAQEAIRPLMVAVFQSVLSSEMTGTNWSADSVVLSRGSLPVSPEIIAIRDSAITGLFGLFKRSTTDEQKREVRSALAEAVRTSYQGNYSNELLKLTLTDGTRIATFFEGEAENLSYEIRETIEHSYLFDYHRAQEIANDENDRFGCRANAQAFVDSIIRLRDRINADHNYVRYKTLVGYETVFNVHWDDEDLDFAKLEKFRSDEADRFIEEISSQNEEEWFALVERCAATNSNDGATFPIFGKFLNNLSRRKPELAQRFLARANSDLMQFLPAFLNGLFLSGSREMYQAQIERCLHDRTHLASLVMHWRTSKPKRKLFIRVVLKTAIDIEDNFAVIQCLLFAMENGEGEDVPKHELFFESALKYLISKNDVRWIRLASFAYQKTAFFNEIAEKDAKLVLDSLLEVSRVDYIVEKILAHIASKHPSLVWEYFGTRLKSRDERRGRGQYEDVPFQFHGLEKELARDTKLAISMVRRWYDDDSELFRFRGGQLLSRVFPKFENEISDEFSELVSNGTGVDADFVLEVMENYRGETSTHEVLKRIVAKYPNDQIKLSSVGVSFDSTGVVTGEFGFADAKRQKKIGMEQWLTDTRPEVRHFAEDHIRQLELDIADEHRRAEERKALRELEYEIEDVDSKENENKTADRPRKDPPDKDTDE